MFRLAKPIFIRTITPLHAGSGQDLGIVDLPIQRERHTSYPKIEGSGLKGAIREVFREEANNDKTKERKINLVFGADNKENSQAGAIGFTDARLLLFPVKSMKGVFGYITSHDILMRFLQDMKIAKLDNIDFVIPIVNSGKCVVANKDFIALNNENVILEEYTFKIEGEVNSIAEKLAEITKIKSIKDRLIILSDDDFKDFVNLSTEVITRTEINPKTGIVVDGALFTEEYLPAESVMYSLVLASPVFKKNKEDLSIKNETDVMNYFNEIIPSVIQVGGNATIGKGIVEIIKSEEVK